VLIPEEKLKKYSENNELPFRKITSFYRDFLHQYYIANPELTGQSYDNQYRHLMDQVYGWSDFYSRHLKTLGVDSHEIVFNAEHLQHAWLTSTAFQDR